MAGSPALPLPLLPLLFVACEIDLERQPDDTEAPEDLSDADGDGWLAGEDCDDSDPDVNPGVTELCNGIDDDCDGDTDEADAFDASLWYPDMDGDGYGAETGSEYACEASDGWVASNDDCDDEDADTYPGAPEVCRDDVMNDCDGITPPCLLSGEIDSGDADAIMLGPVDGDRAGSAVAGVGDVNADGYADLLIGAPNHDGDEADAGAAFLLLGPVSGQVDLGRAAAEIVGKEVEGEAGHSVAAAGDVNADGYADLLIGAPYVDTGASDAGAAYLVLGPVDGELDVRSGDAIMNGLSSIDWAGWAVAGAGDTNGDGYDDLLVGAPYADKNGSNVGAAYLLLGPVSGELALSEADAQMPGETAADSAGLAVDGAGDVDGDGIDDVILGAPGRDQSGTNAGAAYLLLGPVSDLDLGAADIRLAGEAEHDGAGTAVAGAGDVDGDGLDDILVGAPNNDTGGDAAGAVYLVQGSARGYLSLSSAHASILGEAAFDQAGAELEGVGDADGDGLGDFLVGAPGHDQGGTDAGSAYLMLGPVEGQVGLGSALVTVLGSQDGDGAGNAISSAGDSDGDGTIELLVGAPDSSEGGTDRGAAYLIDLVDW